MLTKNKGGRPPHLPTAAQRQQVEILKGLGWPHEVIARFFNIGTRTLEKCYKAELAHGKDKFGCILSITVAQQALKGKLAAAFFLLKTQFGFRENVGVQPLGKNGEPISLERLDDRSLMQLFTALTKGDAGAFGLPVDPAEEDGWSLRAVVTPTGTPN